MNTSVYNTKACSKCGEEKPFSEFSREPRRPCGIQAHCKACKAAYSRAYRKANPEKVAALSRAWAVANPDKRDTSRRAWKAAHPEEHAASQRAYQTANPEKNSARARNYYARKLGNGGAHTAKDVQAQYDHQQGRCYYCDVLVYDDYHVDHVIPISKGGSNGPENLVISCPPCNRSKHNKHPMDWCGQLF